MFFFKRPKKVEEPVAVTPTGRFPIQALPVAMQISHRIEGLIAWFGVYAVLAAIRVNIKHENDPQNALNNPEFSLNPQTSESYALLLHGHNLIACYGSAAVKQVIADVWAKEDGMIRERDIQ